MNMSVNSSVSSIPVGKKEAAIRPTMPELSPWKTNWRNGKITMQSKLKFIIANENPLFDVTFLVGPNKQEISAHKFILILSSKIFEKMILDAQTKQIDKITVADVEPGAFKELLYYIYTDDFNDENFDKVTFGLQVLMAARKFKVIELVKCITKLLKTKLTTENAIRIFECSDITAWEFISRHAQAIFASDEILSLSNSNLCKLIGCDNLELDENTIFEKCISWAKEDCKRKSIPETGGNLRLVLGDILFLIRFTLLSPEDFTFNVLPHDILSHSEQLDVFKYFHLGDSIKSQSFNSQLKFNCAPRYRPPKIAEADSPKINDLESLNESNLPKITITAEKSEPNSSITAPPSKPGPSQIIMTPKKPPTLNSAFVTKIQVQDKPSKDIQSLKQAKPGTLNQKPGNKVTTKIVQPTSTFINNSVITPLEKEIQKIIIEETNQILGNLADRTISNNIRDFQTIPLCDYQIRVECFVDTFITTLFDNNSLRPDLFVTFIDEALKLPYTQLLRKEFFAHCLKILENTGLYYNHHQQGLPEQKSSEINLTYSSKAENKVLHLTNLIVENFKRRLLDISYVVGIVNTWLQKGDDKSMARLSYLLMNCGKELDARLIMTQTTQFGHNWMENVFLKLCSFVADETFKSVTRIKIAELIHFRKNGWAGKKI